METQPDFSLQVQIQNLKLKYFRQAPGRHAACWKRLKAKEEEDNCGRDGLKILQRL